MSADPQAVERIRQLYRQFGHIPQAPQALGCTNLPGFNPEAVAQGIEREIQVARFQGGRGKITLHMDLDDAAQLAAFLRRRRR